MNKIESQLRELRSIKPESGWKAAQKEMLMKQVFAAAREDNKKGGIILYIKEAFSHEMSVLAQPIASVAVIIMIVVGGGVFSITAASEATPGSFLYTVKIVSEKTQFALTTKPEEKIKLRVSFVERRVNEITSVASNNDNKVLGEIAGNLANDIMSVQSELSEIENKDINSALDMARAINSKTTELRQKLVDAKSVLSQLTGDAARQIDDAIEGVDAASLKALSTIIKATGENDDKKDVNSRVATKIESTKEKINEVKESLNSVFSAGLGRSEQGIQIYNGENNNNTIKKEADEKTDEASKVIAEAEKFLAENNYSEALEKINESESLLKEASNAVNSNETQEEQSTSTPEVKGITTTEDEEQVFNTDEQSEVLETDKN